MTNLWFDEIYDSNGRIREHYKSVYTQWKSIPSLEKRKFRGLSKNLFSGDYPLDSLIRVLTYSELSLLQKGVTQWAKAIRAFLFDYYYRNNRWKNIIRDRNGKWRIVEDSAGMLGGIGDLLPIRKIIRKLIPGYQTVLRSSNHLKDFFCCLIYHFQKIASLNKGIPLLYLRPFKHERDHETQRLASIFKSLGCEVITSDNFRKILLIENDKIFLETFRKKERVGYLIFHSDPEQMDRHYSIATFRWLLFKKIIPYQILKRPFKCVLQRALCKNQIRTNFSPGVQFVNDKVFGLFVDSLIHFYLKESPILESIPAKSLTYRSQVGGWRLDKSALKNIIRQKDNFVIKRVDEDGGIGVWIGQKHSRREFNKLQGMILKEPEKYIVQQFEHLSVLENRIVDLRIHTHVDMERIITSNTPWG